MNKISCDIFMDLFPLVKDAVASEDSENAVLDHIKTCEKCKAVFYENEIPPMNKENIITKIKKRLVYLVLTLIVIGLFLGLSLAANEFMFYNVLIMPAIGAVSFLSFKSKGVYALPIVFVSVFLRWVPDTFGYIFNGDIISAILPPFMWGVVYTFLCSLGLLIGFLLDFGFKKEETHEKGT